jgi:hypothetical protein
MFYAPFAQGSSAADFVNVRCCSREKSPTPLHGFATPYSPILASERAPASHKQGESREERRRCPHTGSTAYAGWVSRWFIGYTLQSRVLIELGLAIKEQHISAWGAKGQTGTRAGMAIGF